LYTDTTRPPRKSEEDGKEYHFISTEEMTKNISANEFLEFGSYQGNMFGTKFETVHQIHKQDKIAILDIEPQVGRHGNAGVMSSAIQQIKGLMKKQSSWESSGSSGLLHIPSVGSAWSNNTSIGIGKPKAT
jgi:hypothetical protein